MIKFLSKIDKKKLRGEVAVLRLDFNTEDEWRMQASLPTIKLLLKHGVKVVIVSHRGRPNGKELKFSLRKDGRHLEKFLKRQVVFVPHFRFSEIGKMINKAAAGSVFLLENLRFLRGEENNSRDLAKKLASLGDFYVNDAFAVSHRNDASVDVITRFMPSYAGLEMEREIKHLSRVVSRPNRPLVAIFGGGKAHDKLKVVRYFKNKADVFILGGALANTILKIKGINVGNSTVDNDPGMTIREVIEYKNMVLPIDYIVKDNTILDVGPKTIKLFAEKISKARTIIWNGPLGLIERSAYRKGTLGLAKSIARNRKAFSLVGGGETVMFLKECRLDKKFSFISTGGGAMISYLAGEKLPGIEALKRKR